MHLLAACVLSVSLLGLCLQGRPGNWSWGQISLTVLLSAKLRGNLRIAGHTSAIHLCFQMHRNGMYLLQDQVPALRARSHSHSSLSALIMQTTAGREAILESFKKDLTLPALWADWVLEAAWMPSLLTCSVSADRMAVPSLWSERN